MPLDPSVIAATSGILGSIVGALSSLGTTFMTQRLQARRERMSVELARREELYGEYIEQVTPLFADSVEHTEFDPAKIFGLYSILGRIRLASSDEVLREAEEVIANLLKWYSNPVQEVRVLIEQAARHEVSD